MVECLSFQFNFQPHDLIPFTLLSFKVLFFVQYKFLNIELKFYFILWRNFFNFSLLLHMKTTLSHCLVHRVVIFYWKYSIYCFPWFRPMRKDISEQTNGCSHYEVLLFSTTQLYHTAQSIGLLYFIENMASNLSHDSGPCGKIFLNKQMEAATKRCCLKLTFKS